MLKSPAIALSLAMLGVVVSVQAVPARTNHVRAAKILHARTAVPPSKAAPSPRQVSGEKNWMDHASAPSNSGGGGGGGM